MQKFSSLIILLVVLLGFSIQSVDAARTRTRTPARAIQGQYMTQQATPVYYGNPYTVSNGVTTQTYYFSPTYQQGYTYYSQPTPGYYYFLPVTVPQSQVYSSYNTQPSYQYQTYTTSQTQYYTPQNYAGANSTQAYQQGQYYYPGQYPYTRTVSAYPGCNRANIVIGGQEWAGCNSTDRGVSSAGQSGWFFGGDVQSTFLSYNGVGNTLSWQGKQTRNASWSVGACAEGYRMPTRGEWETAIFYARQNSTTLASLLSLSYNGGFYGYRDSAGNVTLAARTDVNGAYWTSSIEGGVPVVLHLASAYAGYRTDGTDMARQDTSMRWQYTDTGLQLIQSNYSEIANVRCIKN